MIMLGGLIGYLFPHNLIIASYATGSVDGGSGIGDNVGQLIGSRFFSIIRTPVTALAPPMEESLLAVTAPPNPRGLPWRVALR